MGLDARKMKVAVVTFDGFNEINSFVAAHILNRVPGWRAEITGASESITSMNGVVVRAQQPLELAARADAVIIGSGRKTHEIVADDGLMARLQLDPARQLKRRDLYQSAGGLAFHGVGEHRDRGRGPRDESK